MAWLGEVCFILDSERIPVTASERKTGPYPYYGANGVQDYVDDYIFDDELVLLAEDGGNFGSKDKPIAYRVSGKCWVNNHAHVLKPKEGLDVDYLCYALMYYNVDALVNGATRKKLTQADMRKMDIPMRPIPEQKQIVLQLKKIESVIDCKKKQLEHLEQLAKSRFIEMFGSINSERDYPRKQWREVLNIINGKDYKDVADQSGLYPVYGSGGLMGRARAYLCPENAVVIGRKGTIDKPFIVCEKFWNIDTAFGVVPNKDVLHYLYLYWYCKQLDFKNLNKASTLPSTTKSDLLKLWINVPPWDQQEKFATFVTQTEKSKFVILQSLEKLEKLKKALMQQYFNFKR